MNEAYKERPIPHQVKITTFAQLENPRTHDITPQKLKEILEKTKSNGFKKFTPDNVWYAAVGALTGDSEYGARMGIVKEIIAQSLYSPEAFENFVKKTSANEKQEATGLESKYSSRPYKTAKAVRIVFKRENLREDYLTGDYETNKLRRHQTYSAAYQTLGEIVHRIGKTYQDQNLSIEDLLRLAELDHYFSGKWNGTGINLTFTDPGIRDFGAELQQVVERVWRADFHDDTPYPLTQAELFPKRYPGR